eukprot:29329_1
MSEQQHKAIWIIMVCITYLLAILQIYGYYRFNIMGKLRIVTKRYPKLIKIEAFIVIIMLLIAVPLWYYQSLHIYKITHIRMHNIGWILSSLGIHFIVIIEAIRLWLVSFDLNYLYLSKNEKWKSQINHSFPEKNTNWYLLNRNKWGNKKYIIFVASVYYAVLSTLSVISQLYLYPLLANIIDTIFFLLPISITIYAYYKCPKQTELNDNFLFFYEFKLTIIIWCTCLIFSLINQIFVFLHIKIVLWILKFLIYIIATTIPSLLSTLWIPIKISVMDAWNSNINDDLLPLNSLITEEKQAQQTQKTDILILMNDEIKFDLFVQWMHREFSSELVFCFIEYAQ